MRALKDNHFNNSFSQPHQDQAQEVSQEARVDSPDLDRDSLEVGLEVSQVAAAPAASLEVPEADLVEDLEAIRKCQWDHPLVSLRKCSNFPLAILSKVPVV